MLHSSDLKKLPKSEVESVLKKLSPQEWEELQYSWEFWARPNQLAPEGNWKILLALAGRGFGKTRMGTEWVRSMIKKGHTNIGCVAPTKGDVRSIMVEGESGLLSVCHKSDKDYKGTHLGFPNWSPTNNTLTWENGAKARFYSAEDPERLRGPNLQAAWTDELCLVAGTLISTPSGEVTIENLKSGDYVTTRYGNKKVVRAWKTGTKSTLRITTSTGKTLQGTHKHPVMTQKGWQTLGQLKVQESILVSLGMVKDGGERKTTSLTEQGNSFTDTCMNTTLELSQMVSTFITRMKTKVITAFQILNPCLLLNTSRVTSQEALQPTHQSKDTKTLLSSGKDVSQSLTTALGVGATLNQQVCGQSSAQNLVDKKITIKENVVKVEDGGNQEVYNIEVEEVHEYFANGLLNHNCSWNHMQETWDMLQMCLRKGKNPQILISTTPKPSKLLIELHKQSQENPDKVVLVSGSSYENSDNINLDALAAFEGTRLGRQELYAEILTQSAGALWTMDTLNECQMEPPEPDVAKEYWDEKLVRVVVAIDPAMTDNTKSDETGICVAGIDVNGHGYVLEDATGKYSPQGWATKAIELYHKYSADRIVYESNQGGKLVSHTLKTEDPTLPLRGVHAKRSKHVRAEPVAALYEQGKVSHVRGTLEKLEANQTQWEPTQSTGSPDALDACVYALTDLMLGGVVKPKINILSQDTQSLTLF